MAIYFRPKALRVGFVEGFLRHLPQPLRVIYVRGFQGSRNAETAHRNQPPTRCARYLSISSISACVSGL